MAITFPTAWPAALTDAAWQKKKSFMDKAKSKTKTGLGAELIKAQKAWNLVKFDNLIATKVPMTSPDTADRAKVAAQNYLGTVAAAASRAALVPPPRPPPPKTTPGSPARPSLPPRRSRRGCWPRPPTSATLSSMILTPPRRT